MLTKKDVKKKKELRESMAENIMANNKNLKYIKSRKSAREVVGLQGN